VAAEAAAFADESEARDDIAGLTAGWHCCDCVSRCGRSVATSRSNFEEVFIDVRVCEFASVAEEMAIGGALYFTWLNLGKFIQGFKSIKSGIASPKLKGSIFHQTGAGATVCFSHYLPSRPNSFPRYKVDCRSMVQA
jgi:hypothetical protein